MKAILFYSFLLGCYSCIAQQIDFNNYSILINKWNTSELSSIYCPDSLEKNEFVAIRQKKTIQYLENMSIPYFIVKGDTVQSRRYLALNTLLEKMDQEFNLKNCIIFEVNYTNSGISKFYFLSESEESSKYNLFYQKIANGKVITFKKCIVKLDSYNLLRNINNEEYLVNDIDAGDICMNHAFFYTKITNGKFESFVLPICTHELEQDFAFSMKGFPKKCKFVGSPANPKAKLEQ